METDLFPQQGYQQKGKMVPANGVASFHGDQSDFDSSFFRRVSNLRGSSLEA